MKIWLLIAAALVSTAAAPQEFDENLRAQINRLPPEQRFRAKMRVMGLYTVRILRDGMKDPDTFELKSLRSFPDTTMCFTYRAKNSFNAMLRERAVFVPKGSMFLIESDPRFMAAWKKRCDNRDGDEMVDDVKEMLKQFPP